MIKKKERILILSLNKLEKIQLLFCCFIKNYYAYAFTFNCFSSGISSDILGLLRRIPFWKKYEERSLSEVKNQLGEDKSFWYDSNQDVIDLTIKYYNEKFLRKNMFEIYCSKLFATAKMEAFIKKEIAQQMFSMLMNLQLIHLDDQYIGKKIVILKSPINKTVVEFFENKYDVSLDVEYIFSFMNLFGYLQYFLWLMKEVILRGISFAKKKKQFKIVKEAGWGCEKKTFRDDLLIDNKKFFKSDMLFLDTGKQKLFKRYADVYKALQNNGYSILDTSRIKVRFNNLLMCLKCYVYAPIKSIFLLLIEGKYYFILNVCQFYKSCFLTDLVCGEVDFKVFLSSKDWGDVEETIVMNKNGAKSVIFHWSDLRLFKVFLHAFVAHDVFYFWGQEHYDFMYSTSLIDRPLNVGCIFKREYSDALGCRDSILSEVKGLNRSQKTVLFCDTSFNNDSQNTEVFYLQFIELMKKFCISHSEVNVFFKPKSSVSMIEKNIGAKISEYRALMNELRLCDNFYFFDNLESNIMELISVADVCIGMSMNTTCTLSLICKKNALFYERTCNKNHPWISKYFNVLVFNEDAKILSQIDNILKGDFNCCDVVSQEDLRRVDAYDDDKAIERIRDDVQMLVS